MELEHILIVGGFLVLVLAGLLLWMKWQRERKDALHAKAKALGFEFAAKPPPEFVKNYGSLSIFNRTMGSRTKNVMWLQQAKRTIYVFDLTIITYAQTGTLSRKRREEWYTVMLLDVQGHSLPDFTMRPETLGDSIGSWFTGSDIDFKAYPRFSTEYYLQGPDEAAIRNLFDDKLLQLFSLNLDWVVESEDDCLLLYRKDRRPEPEELNNFIVAALRIAKAFGA